MDNFDSKLNSEINRHHDYIPVCIMADKVYAQCQQRKCLENISAHLPAGGCFEFAEVIFHPGKIVEGTLMITPIKNRPNFSRVRFKVKIGYTLKVINTKTGAITSVQGNLPLIEKDIIMFIPEARDEFAFEIAIDTASQLLNDPIEKSGCLVFSVGVFIIIKVVGRVQLLIPEFGFCPPPDECEEFPLDDLCEIFDEEPFPPFFPTQFEDIP